MRMKVLHTNFPEQISESQNSYELLPATIQCPCSPPVQ